MNNILIKKSEDNLKSANKLHEIKCYNSSVHCSYYSVYQYVLNVCKNFNPTEYINIEKEAVKNGNSSHQKTINYITDNCLSLSLNNNEVSLFTRNYNRLKNYRVIGDYKNLNISMNESKVSIELVLNIINTLKKINNGND
ncbi:hypothetical protein [Chishuiella sp.]|uniref:hypothetical protein n=1 Tax=Chishuiella sp. TaxID=1969467 RepID=UPI0028A7CD35|nr:hypothetical protein [Chishuiella sp.]